MKTQRVESVRDIEVGDDLIITIGGAPSGPYRVVRIGGRTPDHAVLRNAANGVLFEHYVSWTDAKVVR